MRIVYFYQYFSTPRGSWGTRVYEFASRWINKGHQVVVISAIYAKSDIKATKFIETKEFDGITVKIINVEINNKHSFPKRIWAFLVYTMVACYYALTLKMDLAIASSGPITVGIPGLITKWIRKKKLVFEVRDIWPQGAIELGIIKNRLIKSIAYRFEKACYTNSSLIVALSPGMKDHIIDNHRHPNVISITNSANLKLFDPALKDVKSINLKSGSYGIYTGNIGEVNNSMWLYETALQLKKRGRSDIQILMIGDGQQKQKIVELKKQNDVDNLIIKNLIPKTELVQYVLNAVVSFVPLKGTPILDTSSPNKFFESLAAGVPIVQNTNGWMKKFLKEHNVGWTIDPNNPDHLANLLVEMFDGKHLLHEMKEKARSIAVNEFDHEILSEQYLRSVEAI